MHWFPENEARGEDMPQRMYAIRSLVGLAEGRLSTNHSLDLEITDESVYFTGANVVEVKES